MPLNRRGCLARSGSMPGAGAPAGAATAAPGKGPRDYRFEHRDKSQHPPIRDFLAPRVIEGGVDVVVMPAGGESVEERALR